MRMKTTINDNAIFPIFITMCPRGIKRNIKLPNSALLEPTVVFQYIFTLLYRLRPSLRTIYGSIMSLPIELGNMYL